MATVFSSQNHDAEQEALAVKGVLDANGIQSTVLGSSVLPVVEFRVEVTDENKSEASRVIAEARAAGPKAAAEASKDAV